MKKIYHVSGKQDWLYLDKLVFKLKVSQGKKRNHYIKIKRSIHPENIKITFTYNIKAPKYIKDICKLIGEI
jgi:hypothetical protein